MADDNTGRRNPMFSNRAYDLWKMIAQIVLPALGTLYFALSDLWHLPYSEQVVGTITAVDVFLGIILAYSTTTYLRTNKLVEEPVAEDQPEQTYDGTFVINTTDAMKDTYSVEFDTPLMDLTSRDTVTLKVESHV